jgi:hypothetical protein
MSGDVVPTELNVASSIFDAISERRRGISDENVFVGLRLWLPSSAHMIGLRLRRDVAGSPRSRATSTPECCTCSIPTSASSRSRTTCSTIFIKDPLGVYGDKISRVNVSHVKVCPIAIPRPATTPTTSRSSTIATTSSSAQEMIACSRKMRATYLAMAALLTGCATVPPSQSGCITVVNTREGSEIYRNGHRVLDDSLEDATEESFAAHALAVRAKSHRWFGLGSLVLGSIMFAPGLGLIGYGAGKQESGAAATGAVLTLSGIGGLIAGVILMGRARTEAGRAVDIYNEERNYCRQ